MNQERTVSSETYELADRLLRVFEALSKLVRYRVPPGIRGPLNLSLTQVRILHLLFKYPGISQKELADRLEVTPAAISQAVRALLAADLVERHSDPQDTRAWQLYLSPYGQNLVKGVLATQRQAVATLLSGLPLEEQHVVVEALERALKQLGIESEMEEGSV